MNTIFTFIAVGLLVLSSLVGPASTSGNRRGDEPPQPQNMSPCLPEDVEACHASGGTFNWSHCYCSYYLKVSGESFE